MKSFKKYWIFALIGTLAASFYPLYMGVRVILDMIVRGTVLGEDFPKYIIPYTPIAVAVITAVAFMPLLFKFLKRFVTLAASCLSLGGFFAAEWLLESKVIVTTTVEATLESWQMYMCYVPPDLFETRTWKAVDVLIGNYSPVFKLHFYLISAVLVIAVVNCLYGFAQMIRTGSRTRAQGAYCAVRMHGVFPWAVHFSVLYRLFQRWGDHGFAAVRDAYGAVFRWAGRNGRKLCRIVFDWKKKKRFRACSGGDRRAFDAGYVYRRDVPS